MRAITDSVVLSTGVSIPYREQGDADGVPVLLLHGYTDSLRSWDPLLAELPAAVRALAPTQRGHGDAGRPATGYRPADFAADAVAFLDAVGVEAAVVAGHSAGSIAAQHVAVEHPHRTLGLVLIGACPTFRDTSAVELREPVSALTDPVDPGFVREFQESTLARPISSEFLDTVVRESLKLPARVWQEAMRGLLEGDAPAFAGTIAAPTLILWGERDDFCVRGDQDELLAAIPNARLSAYEGVGHAVHWEQPDRVAAELAEFAVALAGEQPRDGLREA